MKKVTHLLFQDGILQDTVSNTTFSQTLNFQGGLTPILCTNQDNHFQYRFFARKINPRIWVPRWKNTKTSWNQDILLSRQNFSMTVKFQVYFLPRYVLEKFCLENLYLGKRQLVLIFLILESTFLEYFFFQKIYVGSCCLCWYMVLESNLQKSPSLSWHLLGSVILHLAALENSCYQSRNELNVKKYINPWEMSGRIKLLAPR